MTMQTCHRCTPAARLRTPCCAGAEVVGIIVCTQLQIRPGQRIRVTANHATLKSPAAPVPRDDEDASLLLARQLQEEEDQLLAQQLLQTEQQQQQQQQQHSGAQQNMVNRLRSGMEQVFGYESAEQQTKALAVIPLDELKRRAADWRITGETNRLAREYPADALLVQLMHWFKREFFSWCAGGTVLAHCTCHVAGCTSHTVARPAGVAVHGREHATCNHAACDMQPRGMRHATTRHATIANPGADVRTQGTRANAMH